MKKTIVILASGGGSNARSIIQHFEGDSSVSVLAIISNRKEAGAHQVAKDHDIPSYSFNKVERSAGELQKKVLQLNPDLVVLAGYLLKIPEELTRVYENRMVNIHPSLLPKYGGKGMYGMNVHKAVFKNNDKESGLTIHFVNEDFDDGEIIKQVACNIEGVKNASEIQQKVLVLEHIHYPLEIEKLMNYLDASIRGINIGKS